MPKIDHHSKPYDEGTLAKLDIFENYVEVWLPTFIMQSHVEQINIVDFFAGMGYDANNAKGSPIRILDKIDSFYDILLKHHTTIRLYVNEYDAKKYSHLILHCEKYLAEHERIRPFIEIYYEQSDFNQIFQRWLQETKNSPSLYIIDQCGVEFTKQENFNWLLETHTSDFLFFISSSYFTRFTPFSGTEKFINMERDDLEGNPYSFIHRVVVDKYRKLIPNDSLLQIFPFSIKKGANIYGIIFGSKHIRGVEKFLKIAWNANKLNGEANYDIDEDYKKEQLELNFFEGDSCPLKRLTKIEKFEQYLEEFIQEKRVVTNKEIYYFTYEAGHIGVHACTCLKRLKAEKKVNYSGHCRISWNSIQKNNLVTYRWVGNNGQT